MIPPEFSGPIYVYLLPILESAEDQMDLIANLAEVNPIPGAAVDPQFRNPLPD